LHLNEASERREKKDLCSKEALLPSLNLSRSEEFTVSRGSRPKAVEGEI